MCALLQIAAERRSRANFLQKSWTASLLALGITWFCAVPCRGQAPSRPESAAVVSKEQIRELIEQLGAPWFAVREQASRQLQSLGESAYDELLAATGHSTLEIRHRAAAILHVSQFRTLEKAFQELSRLPDERIDVEFGMWLIARIHNPRVQRASLKKPLDDLAEQVRRRIGRDADFKNTPPQQVLETLRLVIYEEQRFGPNEADYTNPENSTLEFVLAKRRGLPIMMSHVMIAVAERLGWPLVGVATPGRYIVRYDGARVPVGQPKDDLYFDAYVGRQLSDDDLRKMFGAFGRDVLAVRPTNREILSRMMNNFESHLSLHGRSQQAELVAACRAILQFGGPDEME